MSRLEHLPPDQSAALSLLLRRRRGYAELASIIEAAPQALHDRAHAALALLAPKLASRLSAEERHQIGEYLLGQQTRSQADRTTGLLASSPPCREWALALATELRPLAAANLPPIPPAAPEAAAISPTPEAAVADPTEGTAATAGATPEAALADPTEGTAATAGATPEAAVADPTEGTAATAGATPETASESIADPAGGRIAVSRAGGLALLAAIAAIAAIIVFVIVGVGKSSNAPQSVASGHSRSGSSSHGHRSGGGNSGGGNSGGASEAAKGKSGNGRAGSGKAGSGKAGKGGARAKGDVHLKKTLSLTSQDGSAAKGRIDVVEYHGKLAFVLAAEGLQPNAGEAESEQFSYLFWLIGPDGKTWVREAPEVKQNGLMEAVHLLPAKPGSYDQVELTRQQGEAGEEATTPGKVVLEGAFSLH